MLLTEVVDVIIDVVVINFALIKLLKSVKEISPDLTLLRSCQIFVAERQLDSRFERLIERADAIRSQNQDTSVVL